MTTDTITLGAHEFPVIDQPHVPLVHDLVEAIKAAMNRGEDIDMSNVQGLSTESLYDLLCAFYPDLRSKFPLHEFCGFRTPELHAAGEFDREYASRVATIPQMLGAIDAGLEVNGRDLIMRMFGWVDPKARELAWAMVREKMASTWESSVNSPRTSGESDLTSSGESVPPSIPTTEASPSLV